MNRRDVLLLLAGTAALPDKLLAVGQAVHKQLRLGRAGLRAFNPHQSKTVAVIAELIIPETDTPGARAAGVPAFIDVMLVDWADDDHRRTFTAGLANVDERARAAFGKDFIGCSAAQQTQILTDLDLELARLRDKKADTSKNFFQSMKWLTLAGYYTSEIGATSEQHYQVVPGRWEPCYPLDQ